MITRLTNNKLSSRIPSITLSMMPKDYMFYFPSSMCSRLQFFIEPVTDLIAPGYSNIITQPMCFATMRDKVAKGDYTTLQQCEVSGGVYITLQQCEVSGGVYTTLQQCEVSGGIYTTLQQCEVSGGVR